MTVPVMRTTLKVGDLSIPITEIFNNNEGYVRNELDPILLNPSQPKMHFKQKKKMELNGLLPVEKKTSLQASATSSLRSDTMKCPHKIDKSDGTKADCQYVTNRIGNYRRHEKDMHINVHKVECCNLRFLYRADFRLHATENHNGGKEFQCLECPATFIRRALLIRHLSVHDPSRKNHKCHLCPYSTSHATNLQRHYRVHENEIMGVNWDGEYEEEAYGFSMEEYGGGDVHSFYQYNPYLYEVQNVQVARTHAANGKRKRPMEEDCSTEIQFSTKKPMNQINYETEQNTSKDERVSSDIFSAISTEEVIKEEQHCLLDNPSYYYPSFISFPNWHPILLRSDPSSGFNGLPSLDSALSTRGRHISEAFPLDSAFSTRGPVPQKSFLSTHGPELHKSSHSTLNSLDCVPTTHRPELYKSSHARPGQVPQISTLYTNRPVPQNSSLVPNEPVPQKSSLFTDGQVPQKRSLSTNRPVHQINSLSTNGKVPPKSTLSLNGQLPQKSSLSTPGQDPQQSSHSTHAPVPQKSGVSPPMSKRIKLNTATVRCSPPAGPVWISTHDEDCPDVKPQFFLSEENVLSSPDDQSSQYQFSQRVLDSHSDPCSDQKASQYHLTELAPLKK